MVSSREKRFHAACLIVTPWIELLINPNLFMTPGGNGYLDPWFYTGFFLSLPEYLARFPGTYYGARISWLLPGYLAHRVFSTSPIVANYVLHLSFFYALIAGVYLLVASAVNRRAALLVALVVGWNPFTLTALSWDYPDGSGVVFLVLTLLCLDRAVNTSRGRRMAWAAGGGAFAVCLATSNLFLLLLWPVLGMFAWLRLGTARWREVLTIAGGSALGVAGAVVAFGLVNERFGGPFQYFMPQITMARSQMTEANPWKAGGFAWLLRATWLVTIVLTGVGGLVALLTRSLVPRSLAWTMQIVVLVAVALWVVAENAGSAVLQFSYYTSYLSVVSLIALTLQADVSEARLDTRPFVAIACATMAILAASHWFILSEVRRFWIGVDAHLAALLSWPAVRPDADRQIVSTVIAAASGLVALAVLRMVATPGRRWLAFMPPFVLMSAAVPPDLPLRSTTGAHAYFRETVTMHRYIAAQLPPDRRLRIWFSAKGVNGPVIGVASSFLWAYSLVNYELPKLTADDVKQLDRHTRLVLLLSSPAQLMAVQPALADAGLTLSIVSQASFGSGDMRLYVVIGDLT